MMLNCLQVCLLESIMYLNQEKKGRRTRKRAEHGIFIFENGQYGHDCLTVAPEDFHKCNAWLDPPLGKNCFKSQPFASSPLASLVLIWSHLHELH